MRKALAVMFKAPVPGLVKTRLAPQMDHAEASILYRCFLDDIFRTASSIEGVDLFGAYAPEGAGITGIAAPGSATLVLQEGKDLGERMYNLFRSLFSQGYDKAVIIGSDSPDLPADYLIKAFDRLSENECRLILGPAMDGGYYLIGLDILTDAPFLSMDWSTPTVLKETLRRAARHGLPFSLLPEWHDMDSFEDLGRLVGANAPSTAEFISRFKKRSS